MTHVLLLKFKPVIAETRHLRKKNISWRYRATLQMTISGLRLRGVVTGLQNQGVKKTLSETYPDIRKKVPGSRR